MTLRQAIAAASGECRRFDHDHSQAAKNARAYRDALLRHAYREGVTVRALASAADMSLEPMHRIVRTARATRQNPLDGPIPSWAVAA